MRPGHQGCAVPLQHYAAQERDISMLMENGAFTNWCMCHLNHDVTVSQCLVAQNLPGLEVSSAFTEVSLIQTILNDCRRLTRDTSCNKSSSCGFWKVCSHHDHKVDASDTDGPCLLLQYAEPERCLMCSHSVSRSSSDLV